MISPHRVACMPLSSLPVLIMTFAMGIVFATNMGQLGTKMLERLRRRRLFGRRLYPNLPTWTARAFGIWALAWGVAEIFIIRAIAHG
jgi:hypothetical protein